MDREDIIRVLTDFSNESFNEGFRQCAYWVVNNLHISKDDYDKLDEYMNTETGQGFNKD